MSEEIILMLHTAFGYIIGFTVMGIIIKKYGVYFWERWL